ncbi:hypothetical protein AVEN_197966-1, partial [Araneus ventricosus]
MLCYLGLSLYPSSKIIKQQRGVGSSRLISSRFDRKHLPLPPPPEFTQLLFSHPTQPQKILPIL